MNRILTGLGHRPSTLVALVVILLVVIAAVLAPWLAPFSPNDQPFDGLSMEGAPLPPGAKYWLGTDTLGRDLLSRLLFGARISCRPPSYGAPRHCHHGAARGDAEFPGRRRAAAAAVLGQHHLREPKLLPGRALACVHSGRHHPGDALSFNLVGDALRDLLDPTQRGRG